MVDRRFHILATEDDTDIRGLLLELLEGEGYRVTLSSAQDVGEVARLAPDLILLDWWNTSTGARTDFLDRLKADAATVGIPVVVLTGATREVADHEPHFAGIDVTIVPKPFDIDALLDEVRRRLG